MIEDSITEVDQEEQGLRQCTECEAWKSKDDFHKNKNGPDGLNYNCKDCAKARAKQWSLDNPEKRQKYRQETKEQTKERNRRYYEANREGILRRLKENPDYQETARRWRARNSQRIAAKQALWLRNNHEKHAENQRRWRTNNPDKIREVERRYRINSPEKYKEKFRKARRVRRARMAGVGGSVTTQEWQALLDFYGNVCLCCKTPVAETKEGVLTQDHIVPISKGGEHAIQNLQPLCRSCNSRKKVQTIDYRPNLPEWINPGRPTKQYQQLALI